MCEVKERSSYGWEILNKVIVEINKAYESLHISPVFQGGPITDSSDFYGVYCNFVLWDN